MRCTSDGTSSQIEKTLVSNGQRWNNRLSARLATVLLNPCGGYPENIVRHTLSKLGRELGNKEVLPTRKGQMRQIAVSTSGAP